MFREEEFSFVSTGRYEFRPRIQSFLFIGCCDVVFLPKTEVAAFCCWRVWFSLFDYFPGYVVGGLFCFQFPYILAEFSAVFFFFVVEAGFV